MEPDEEALRKRRRQAARMVAVAAHLPRWAGADRLYRRAWPRWGNGYAATTPVVADCRRLLETGRFDAVVELGSGMSTLLLARVAARRRTPMTTLEHLPGWAEVVRQSLPARHRGVLRLVPLVDHGDAKWFFVPVDDLPQGRLLVFCDGPPGRTRGGRRGVLTTVVPRCAPGSVFVLDDVNRDAERDLLADVHAVLGGTVRTHHHGTRAYGVIDTRG